MILRNGKKIIKKLNSFNKKTYVRIMRNLVNSLHEYKNKSHSENGGTHRLYGQRDTW